MTRHLAQPLLAGVEGRESLVVSLQLIEQCALFQQLGSFGRRAFRRDVIQQLPRIARLNRRHPIEQFERLRQLAVGFLQSRPAQEHVQIVGLGCVRLAIEFTRLLHISLIPQAQRQIGQ